MNKIAEETEKNQEQFFDFKELNKLSACKNNQEILCNLYHSYDLEKEERCKNCARHVFFKHLQHSENQEDQFKLDQLHTCRSRFCAICVWRRQAKFSKLTYQALTELLETRKLRFLFLTLTVRNPDIVDLKDTRSKMQEGFRLMTRSAKWKKSILGFCRVFELTSPKSSKQKGKIHPHFHVLLVVKPSYFNNYSDLYITRDEFCELWQRSLKIDYKPFCDVRIVKSRGSKDGVLSSISELIKYPMKDTDLKRMSWEEFKLLDEQMFKTRAINYGGILKESNKVDMDAIELNEEDIELWKSVARLLFEYSSIEKGYKFVRSERILDEEDYENFHENFVVSVCMIAVNVDC